MYFIDVKVALWKSKKAQGFRFVTFYLHQAQSYRPPGYPLANV